MIIAVDFDNTLALGNYAHISLLAPNRQLIERLRALKQTINPEIKIVTARGAKDRLREKSKRKKYAAHITEWLNKYGVPFDQISFNKEYANLYIDDQTIAPLDDFTGEISGFTGNKVVLTENMAIKTCKTALFEFEWYKEARTRGFNVPDVLFCNDCCIITQWQKCYRKPTAADFIQVLERFKGMQHGENMPFSSYLENLPTDIQETSEAVKRVLAELPGKRHYSTFFHGDLSTTNVLGFGPDGGAPILIDPNYKHIFGSYLTDAGKAVFSLIAYEANYPDAEKIVEHFGKEVLHFAVAEGLRVCKYREEYVTMVNNIADLI